MASNPSSNLPTVPEPERLMTAALLVGLLAATLALMLFSWLGREVLLGVTLPFDLAVRDGLHAAASPRLTSIMIAASRYGGPGSLVPLGLVLGTAFLIRGWHRGAFLVGVTLAGAGLIDTLLKHSFGRVRPAAFFGYPLPASESFPSGHAFFSASILGGLAVLVSGRIRSRLLRVLLWSVTIPLILLIGLSRVYLGVHYPSDVLAGYTVAVIWITAIATGDRVASYRRRRIAG